VNSFQDFYSDVGSPPSDKHTIGRIDNNGNYEPGNVRWETRHDQSRNTRNNRWFEIDGKKLCFVDVAKEYGIKVSTFQSRLTRGDTLKQAVRPVHEEKR
jgi:hypothetical protein